MHIVQKRGDVVMSKRKKFLSLLMGAISSLSIAGAKGRKNESKKMALPKVHGREEVNNHV